MIKAFNKSRIAFAVVCVLAAVVIVLLWVNKAGDNIYVRIGISVLTAAAGLLFARSLSNVIASAETTNRLGILHMDLDPWTFIEQYRDIPGRLAKGTQDHAVASSYLSDGYLASGDPEKALEILDEGFEGVSFDGKEALKGLYLGNRLGCLTDLGDTARAKEAADELEALIRSLDKKNTALSESLTATLLLRRARLGIAEGSVIDSDWLKGLLPNAHYKLRELEILRTIAENALVKGNEKEAREYLDKIETGGGKTFYSVWAANRKEALS